MTGRSRKPRDRDLQRKARAKAKAEGTNYTTALRLLREEQEEGKLRPV